MHRIILSLAALLFAGGAHAYAYLYSGQSFTFASGPYTTGMFLNGHLHVDNALTDGSYDLLASPPAGFGWHFLDGLHTFSSAESGDFASNFTVTLAGGTITHWNISLFDSTSSATLITQPGGDISQMMGPAAITVMGSNALQGTWEPEDCGCLVVDGGGSVPEPGSLVLLALGLAALRLRRVTGRRG